MIHVRSTAHSICFGDCLDWSLFIGLKRHRVSRRCFILATERFFVGGSMPDVILKGSTQYRFLVFFLTVPPKPYKEIFDAAVAYI